MARKEWIQLRRDPRSMVLAFGMPVLMLVFFGYAISWDITDIPIAVLDQDRTARSRHLIDAFEASGYFTVVSRPERASDIDDALVHGRVTGALTIPPGFTRDLAAGRPAAIQLLLDGSDANTATVALNYSSAIAAGYSRDVLLQGRSIEAPATAETRVWYNPTLESSNMIVPGLIAVVMSIIAAMLTALTIAREWERGTMEQLAATPVHRLEVVFGKLLPYLGIGMFDVATTVLAGVLIFGVPLRGSILLLAAMTLLFLLGALGLGMAISAVLKSQVLATQVAMVATYLPALLLSGFLFDIASMPAALRAVSYIVPAKYYIAVTRGVFLKGVGIDVLWIQGISMVAFATVGIALATAAFRKRIEA
ncbi:MAG: ABC transporter permease [Gemmatimonadetes bacterium]|nr:ABC transporter permease [Gemmatimonadota bacterium]